MFKICVLLSLITLPLGLTYAQLPIEFFLTMSDGVKLDVTKMVPSTQKPDSGYPAIILIHGLSGNKNDTYLFSLILVPKGYLTLAYSVRGQGNSGGVSTLNGERERQDLREIIAYLRSDPLVNKNRTGIMGGSQGGIHAWAAAALDMGVQVAIPIIATPNYANDLVPNNCIKTGLVNELSLDTSRVRYSADRDRVMNFIYEDNYDSVRVYTEERDLDALVSNIKIPVMIVLGWQDLLFSTNGGITAYQRIKTPTKLYLGPFAHGGADWQDQPEALQTLAGWLIRWIDYWLKDENNGILTEGNVIYANDVTWTHHQVETWPPPNLHNYTFYFQRNGKLNLKPPTESTTTSVFKNEYRDTTYTVRNAVADKFTGAKFSNALVPTPAYFQSDPFTEDVEFTGIPSLNLYISGTGSKYQVNVQIHDVDSSNNKYFLTRGNWGVRRNQSGTIVTSRFDANAYSHIFKKGHSMGITVTTVDAVPGKDVYMIPFFATSTNTLYHSSQYPSSITVPIVGAFTGVEAPSPIPQIVQLYQNYPNPFNPTTSIEFQVSSSEFISLKVHDVLGREVATLVNERKYPGRYIATFDIHGTSGTTLCRSNLASGAYFYQLRTGQFVETKKMVLIR